MAEVKPRLDVKGALRFVPRAQTVDMMIMTCWRHGGISLATEMDASFGGALIDARIIHLLVSVW
jgi:hypothetical protein